MAYFLKKSKKKKGMYLQLYESFYDPQRKQTAHRSHGAIGYVDDLIKSGIPDPVAYYKDQIARLNAERKARVDEEKTRQISSKSALRYLGHFPFMAINRALGVRKDLSYMDLYAPVTCSVCDVLEDLVAARLVAPASKRKSLTEIIPLIVGANSTYSLDQLYTSLEFLGSEYLKVIEVYNTHIASYFERDTSKTYFDCTNFYFEIDTEDDLRRKGPSKEKKTDPIVGLALLLDAHCIPLTMAIYPGNESEKPMIKKTIDTLSASQHLTGKTVRVADKGLNCANNIVDAIFSGDGYLFSRSVKTLSAKEQAWVKDETGFKEVRAKDGTLIFKHKSIVDAFDYNIPDSNGKKKPATIKEKRVVIYNPVLAKKQLREIDRQVEKARNLRVSQAKRKEYGHSAIYVTFNTIDENGEVLDDTIVCSLNHDAIRRDRALAGYNLLITSEVSMKDEEIYSTYHNLWRIEESFKAMKSYLDARPVYVRKPNSVKGHFLVVYVAVLLERLLQIKVLRDDYGIEKLTEFAHNFRVAQASATNYINLARRSELIDDLKKLCGLPLTNFYLKKSDVVAIATKAKFLTEDSRLKKLVS